MVAVIFVVSLPYLCRIFDSNKHEVFIAKIKSKRRVLEGQFLKIVHLPFVKLIIIKVAVINLLTKLSLELVEGADKASY
jgi:hypothetical protein